MRYKNIHKGIFLSRPNRFIAYVDIDGEEVKCHVKNTGRCRELLVSGCTVYLEKSDDPARKTAYDLVAVVKNGRLINMDSQAPNKAVKEWLENVKPFGDDMKVFPERTYGSSRFDFMLKSDTGRTLYLEVKGCTLEQDGEVLFPDAPTERGLKHINELIKCREVGFEAAVLILVQMSDVRFFSPNDNTQPAFGEALLNAYKRGVKLLCYDCDVTPDTLTVKSPVEMHIGSEVLSGGL